MHGNAWFDGHLASRRGTAVTVGPSIPNKAVLCNMVIFSGIPAILTPYRVSVVLFPNGIQRWRL